MKARFGTSGAHFNPAVTIAFASVGRFPARKMVPCIASQCLGAVLGSAAHVAAYGWGVSSAAALGATFPSAGGVVSTLAMEAALTFFLMFVIMAVATDRKVSGGVTGLAIGAAVCFGCIAPGGSVAGRR